MDICPEFVPNTTRTLQKTQNTFAKYCHNYWLHKNLNNSYLGALPELFKLESKPNEQNLFKTEMVNIISKPILTAVGG